MLDLVQPALEAALRETVARERLVRALAADPPPGTALVVLDGYGEIEHSSLDAERWLAEHFEPAEHAGWLPAAVAAWLALYRDRIHARGMHLGRGRLSDADDPDRFLSLP